MLALDLSVTFVGLPFANPFVVAASPATHTGDQVRRALDLGWAGVVWKTLGSIAGVPQPKVSPCYAGTTWEEDLRAFENIDLGNDFPLRKSFRQIREVKRDYPRSRVIVSIRGENSAKKWRDLARRAEDAGADMLELMFSCPHDIADLAEGEGIIGRQAETITRWVREAADVPIMVKMSPNVTDIRVPARAAKAGGADAVSAANTIRCLLGVDLETLRPVPTVGGMSSFGGLSGPAIKPVILRFVAELARDPKLKLPICAIGGISTWSDAVEYLLVGARLLQVGTATMVHGFRIIDDLISGLGQFMERKGFSSVEEWIGRSLPYLTSQPSLDRRSTVKAKIHPQRCIGCLRCLAACRDGGYGAIRVGPERQPVISVKKCKGCSLCMLVCPVSGAIEMTPAAKKA